ncbi:TetR/AcrR family transcriptional regulator [Nocardia aurantiaca]|uniref:TetR family transcriptional regulator n=1 Tax=Nocardia aurantiaca TaxID=2675850 RepID=A0A6I3KTX8_9NOCA|nr:TetR/AcrR family transcriptional regulator [Nocardia aurantiaca]MTE12957.1 TetR family transcriptional regulator [Nocardia aurantiaca]
MPTPTLPRATPNTRSDARRNRALVLAAAHRALAEGGVTVSLAEIARRAGVGAGTVYRHFPTKTALLEAVMQQRIDRLTGLAHRLRDAPDAGRAFFAFCTEVITSTHRNQAVCDMVSNDGWPRELVRDAGARFHSALDDLLIAAQRQGAVRADLTLADVLALFTGCVAIQRLTSDHELARPAALVLDSMRARPAARVTKDRNRFIPRDETPSRNETAASHCPICASPIRSTGTGRPARYCSAACRQKAHRRRRAAAPGPC